MPIGKESHHSLPAGQCEGFHKCIREQFVMMYEDNLLFHLVEEQRQAHPSLDGEYPDLDDVKRGPFDINEVLASPYFFR